MWRVFSAFVTLMCQFMAHGALKVFRGQDEAIGFGAFLSRLGSGDNREPSWVSRSWLLPVSVSCQRRLLEQTQSRHICPLMESSPINNAPFLCYVSGEEGKAECGDSGIGSLGG